VDQALMTDNLLALLRPRLVALRDDVLHRLGEGEALDGGLLRLLAGVNAGLDALDSVLVEAVPAERAVVVDDGREVRLVSYAGANAVASFVLNPRSVVGLAGELIAAASRRLR
jgi:hypothetical protein